MHGVLFDHNKASCSKCSTMDKPKDVPTTVPKNGEKTNANIVTSEPKKNRNKQ